MNNINIFNQIICGDIEMVQAAIAVKYQTIRQNDMEKLRIDILATARITDPIYLTREYKIVDGWKRLVILKSLYNSDEFQLTVEPTIIIVGDGNEQEEIYISKNVMVNRYKKSWLAIIAAENNLPETRRIAAARKGIKQEKNYDACTEAGKAFGISNKTIQQAESILKSSAATLLRDRIRMEELTIDKAYGLVSKQLDQVLAYMQEGKTYQQAMNIFMRDVAANRDHQKYQMRQEFIQNNPLEYQATEKNSPVIKLPTVAEVVPSATINTEVVPSPKSKPLSLVASTRFIGALSDDCPSQFRYELELLLQQYMPNSNVVFVKDRIKLQKLVHENLSYDDMAEAA